MVSHTVQGIKREVMKTNVEGKRGRPKKRMLKQLKKSNARVSANDRDKLQERDEGKQLGERGRVYYS